MLLGVCLLIQIKYLISWSLFAVFFLAFFPRDDLGNVSVFTFYLFTVTLLQKVIECLGLDAVYVNHKTHTSWPERLGRSRLHASVEGCAFL